MTESSWIFNGFTCVHSLNVLIFCFLTRERACLVYFGPSYRVLGCEEPTYWRVMWRREYGRSQSPLLCNLCTIASFSSTFYFSSLAEVSLLKELLESHSHAKAKLSKKNEKNEYVFNRLEVSLPFLFPHSTSVSKRQWMAVVGAIPWPMELGCFAVSTFLYCGVSIFNSIVQSGMWSALSHPKKVLPFSSFPASDVSC